jgi:Rrf2 family protein
MVGKATEYAIRALVYVYIQNQDGKRPGYKEIAEKTDAPVQFVAKIMQTLTRSQLVSSMKGRGGGFFFDDFVAPLTLYEVIRVMEGEKFFSKCGFGLKRCDSDNPCPLHDEYSIVREGFFHLVTNQTIQTMALKINDRKAILTRL